MVLGPNTVISCDCKIDGIQAFDTGAGSQNTASIEILLSAASVDAPFGGSFTTYSRDANLHYLVAQARVIKQEKLRDEGFSSAIVYVFQNGSLHPTNY